ncbi:MAG: phosphohydrolase, partial [Armatimonadota bacterium]
IKYFYHRAKEQSADDHVDESQFRHVGVKPRFKEAGVLMIADTVEAAARTLNDPSPSAIEALVNRLTQDKIDDGQLDESDLTFDDVRIIKRLLVRMLNSMFHQRVRYPEDESRRS